MRQRPLIAAIFPAVHDDCQGIVWPGVADYAHSNNIDLLTFVATSQNKVATFEPHYEIVRQLIKNLRLDGLVIYTGAFSDHFTNLQLKEFCTSLNDCPVVCIHQKVDGLKSILINNALGIEKTVDHLFSEHGCRTFSFVKGLAGHSESEERFRVFCKELEKRNIEINNDLIFDGHFVKESGIEAAVKILKLEKLPDAVMAVNDSTALGLIAEFSRNKVGVPEDICITGFDDVPEARNHVPSLTTVSQPLYEIGQLAIKSLMSLIRGQVDNSDIIVPTQFVPRQSCGCIRAHIDDYGSRYNSVLSDKLEPIRSKKQFIEYCASLLSDDGSHILREQAEQWIEDLLDALKSDIRSENKEIVPDRFIERLTFHMIQYIAARGDALVWQEVLSILAAKWRQLIRAPEAAQLVEEIFSRSRMCVSDFLLRMNLAEELVKDDSRAFIRNIMLSLITAFDMERVKSVLKDNLPSIGIGACHLVLYNFGREGVDIEEFKLPSKSLLVFSFNEKGVIWNGSDLLEFETSMILPEKVWAMSDTRNDLLFPIVFEKRNYGYVMFQRNKDLPHYVYEELRIHIGNALRGHNLVNELREMSLRDELTGLYNRRGFSYLGNHILSQARRTGLPVTMMYGDMNKLKYINDTFGHGEGDFAIAKTGNILKSIIRDQDVIARIGGDEFAIVAVALSRNDCEGVVARIDAAFDEFNKLHQRPYNVSISVGYTHQILTDDLSIGDLLDTADKMLGKIKKQRKEK